MAPGDVLREETKARGITLIAPLLAEIAGRPRARPGQVAGDALLCRTVCVGGDGAMYDIGFQALSRMVMSGLDIKVLVLDTQVYSNTGGQTSTSTFTSQDAKMSQVGRANPGGKTEHRKEMAQILMMHPNAFVAQTIAGNPSHFYKTIMAANEYPGPAVVIAYTTCQPEHGVADDSSMLQEKLAVESRAFPLLVYDPRKGGGAVGGRDVGDGGGHGGLQVGTDCRAKARPTGLEPTSVFAL